jgi:hypothetical protein
MAAPVCGFRAVRALRCDVLNVPKPTKVIGFTLLERLGDAFEEGVHGGRRSSC